MVIFGEYGHRGDIDIWAVYRDMGHTNLGGVWMYRDV